MCALNAQRPGQLAWTRRDPATVAVAGSAQHFSDTVYWLQGPNKHRIGGSSPVCHDIKEVVDAIAQVNISIAALAEHHLIALRSSVVEGMAAAFRPRVGLRFNN